MIRIRSDHLCLARFLGIIVQDPSVTKSSQLHVDVFQFFFIDFKYIP